MIILFLDTETTGKLDFNASHISPNQPDLVQLAACLFDERSGLILGSMNTIISPYPNADATKPLLFKISPEVSGIHGISQAQAIKFGVPRRTALSLFNFFCRSAEAICAHNKEFDKTVMLSAYHREEVPHRMEHLKEQCTMKAATPILKLPKPFKATKADPYKWPSLMECYKHFFNVEFEGAHNAMNDVMAMVKVWIELRKIGAI